MNAIFVYGLLKPGYSLHHVVAPYVTDSTSAVARGRLYDAGVPAARFDEDGVIEGFVLWLDEGRLDEALAVLDDVEDEGEVYSRITVDVASGVGAISAHGSHYLPSLEGRPMVGERWPKD